MKAIQLFFVALSAAVVAIPGMSALGTEAWWPPGDASTLFRAVATVAGSGVLLLMLLARARIAAAPARYAGPACVGGLFLALSLLFAYFALLERAVVEYEYYGVDRSVVVPFGVGSWASEELLQQARKLPPTPGLAVPRTRAQVTREHVRVLFATWGDGMKPFIPGSRTWRTWGILLFLYCGCITLLVATFTGAGIRLGSWELGGDDADEPAPAPATPTAAAGG
jgi:hypothetical protein